MAVTRRNIGWIYRRRHIDPADIRAIGAAISTVCDDVHLYAINREVPDGNAMKNVMKSPCVFFSQDDLPNSRPPRGRVFASASIQKLEQAEIFRKHGILHPQSSIYRPQRLYTEDEFGSLVLVKPTRTSNGRGIFVIETRLIGKYRELMAKHEREFKCPTMIQSYIDTGDHVSTYRVLLLFGAVMYALKRRSLKRRPIIPLTEVVTRVFIQSHEVEKDTAFCHEADVLETAQKVAAALPEVPIIGVDLVREAVTGDVYVIEANIGNTWHLSSESGKATRVNVGGRGVLEKEFDSWNVAAKRLIALAREHAA